jgi:hypothetical protein
MKKAHSSERDLWACRSTHLWSFVGSLVLPIPSLVLPIANVTRIMKNAKILPIAICRLSITSLVLTANAKISKDAKETVQECLLDFINFVTGVHQLRHQFINLLEFISFVSFISSSALFG